MKTVKGRSIVFQHTSTLFFKAFCFFDSAQVIVAYLRLDIMKQFGILFGLVKSGNRLNCKHCWRYHHTYHNID